MTVGEIKALVMFQTNNDAEDVDDYLPYLGSYVSEGYDRLVYAWAGVHPTENDESYPTLTHDNQEPNLPEWLHKSIADWATWLVYRNGNPDKQNRGYTFRTSFEETLRQIAAQGGEAGSVKHFTNIPY